MNTMLPLETAPPRDDMSSFRALRVVSDAAWVADDFAAAGVIPVIHNYGFDPPRPGDALWCAGSYANRGIVTDSASLPNLTCPDFRFMDRVPRQFTHRRVVTRTISEWREVHDPGHGFVKLPLMKQALFPAAEFTSLAQALSRIAEHYQATDHALVEQIHLQHSEVVQFAREFRCFVADGVITAASFYLETIRDADGTVLSDTTWQAMDEASARDSAVDAVLFATEVIASIDSSPAGYTLDVGQLTDGTWAVVEANAAWSSNPYHADSAGAIASVLASQRPGHRDMMFAWAPERAFLTRVNPFRT